MSAAAVRRQNRAARYYRPRTPKHLADLDAVAVDDDDLTLETSIVGTYGHVTVYLSRGVEMDAPIIIDAERWNAGQITAVAGPVVVPFDDLALLVGNEVAESFGDDALFDQADQSAWDYALVTAWPILSGELAASKGVAA